jgi:hypothetical protein
MYTRCRKLPTTDDAATARRLAMQEIIMSVLACVEADIRDADDFTEVVECAMRLSMIADFAIGEFPPDADGKSPIYGT